MNKPENLTTSQLLVNVYIDDQMNVVIVKGTHCLGSVELVFEKRL